MGGRGRRRGRCSLRGPSSRAVRSVGRLIEFSVRKHRRLHDTDDTVLTFALARALLERGALEAQYVQRVLAAAHAADPDRGFGRTPRVLELVDRGVPWDEAPVRSVDGQGSASDGAAMRVVPVAIVARRDRALLRQWAALQATTTHTHPLAVCGATVQATAVATAMSSGRVDAGQVMAAVRGAAEQREFRARLERIEGLLPDAGVQVVARETGTGSPAVDAVPTAIYCALRHPTSVREAVSFAIRLGGDTDTIASMAAAIVGAGAGVSAREAHWIEHVEGTSTACLLADGLVDLARRRAAWTSVDAALPRVGAAVHGGQDGDGPCMRTTCDVCGSVSFLRRRSYEASSP